MKKKIKNILLLLLTCISVISITGCDSDKDEWSGETVPIDVNGNIIEFPKIR